MSEKRRTDDGTAHDPHGRMEVTMSEKRRTDDGTECNCTSDGDDECRFSAGDSECICSCHWTPQKVPREPRPVVMCECQREDCADCGKAPGRP